MVQLHPQAITLFQSELLALQLYSTEVNLKRGISCRCWATEMKAVQQATARWLKTQKQTWQAALCL